MTEPISIHYTEASDDPNGLKRVHKIYLDQLAKHICLNSKQYIIPDKFKKLPDFTAYRLALTYVATYLAHNRMAKTLDLAKIETNGQIKTDRHNEKYVARCLRVDPDLPVIPQLIGLKDINHNDPILERGLPQPTDININNKGHILQSMDESQFTLQSIIAEEEPLRQQSAHRHHHHRHRQRPIQQVESVKNLEREDPETFTQFGIEPKEMPMIWDASYGLNDEKKVKLNQKQEARAQRRANRPPPPPSYTYSNVPTNDQAENNQSLISQNENPDQSIRHRRHRRNDPSLTPSYTPSNQQAPAPSYTPSFGGSYGQTYGQSYGPSYTEPRYDPNRNTVGSTMHGMTTIDSRVNESRIDGTQNTGNFSYAPYDYSYITGGGQESQRNYTTNAPLKSRVWADIDSQQFTESTNTRAQFQKLLNRIGGQNSETPPNIPQANSNPQYYNPPSNSPYNQSPPSNSPYNPSPPSYQAPQPAFINEPPIYQPSNGSEKPIQSQPIQPTFNKPIETAPPIKPPSVIGAGIQSYEYAEYEEDIEEEEDIFYDDEDI